MNHSLTGMRTVRRDQQGVVMVIALIALLLLSLIGTTAMRNSTMQEKISGNMRDQDIAFQAAEAALREAEAYLESITTLAQFNDTGGLYQTGNAPDVFTAWPNDARTYNNATLGNLAYVSAAPEYIIEIRGTVDESVNTSLNLSGGYGISSGTGDIFIFKIHARGAGQTDTSQVILRTNYAKRF